MAGEVVQLKVQNHELRAKVIRQDAAWKRKIESERRKSPCSLAASRAALTEDKSFRNSGNLPLSQKDMGLSEAISKVWV